MATLHLEAKKLSQKANKIFDASRASLRDPVVCRGTAVENHWFKQPIKIIKAEVFCSTSNIIIEFSSFVVFRI